MNINVQGGFGGMFGSTGLLGGGLKSTQEKLGRQAERDSKVAFFEQQKENLKDMKCETLEDIARKLEMFHSYEDQIAAAKAAYNNEQMRHVLDEAQEQGEKNAEAAKDMEAKTPEERREEMREEALGIEESDGILDEMFEAVEEMAQQATEAAEEMAQQTGELTEQTVEAAGEQTDRMAQTLAEQAAETTKEVMEQADASKQLEEEYWKQPYHGIDYRV